MSTSFSHTPGPWFVDSYGQEIYAKDKRGKVVVVPEKSIKHDANATLIARAPDLLAENERLRAERNGLAKQNAELIERLARHEVLKPIPQMFTSKGDQDD